MEDNVESLKKIIATDHPTQESIAWAIVEKRKTIRIISWWANQRHEGFAYEVRHVKESKKFESS